MSDFSYDLKPTVGEVYGRIDKPVNLPLGDANGCAELRVLSVEAGPTVLADGLEKDLALVVAPQVTMPCTAAGQDEAPLPPFANVATLQGGPFTVTVPIAARYEELAKAMSLAFTDGKLFFSKEYPALYMEKPEVYAAKDQVVLKLHIAGPVRKFIFDSNIDGDIFFTGHPVVEDNELRIPDLEPTVDTKNLLSETEGHPRRRLHPQRGARRAAPRHRRQTSVGSRQALHRPRVRRRQGVPSGRRRQDRGDRGTRSRLVFAALRGDDRARLGVHALSAIALLRLRMPIAARSSAVAAPTPRPPRTLWANAYLAPGTRMGRSALLAGELGGRGAPLETGARGESLKNRTS